MSPSSGSPIWCGPVFEKQDLFINQQIATSGLQILWMLFRNGGLDNHGAFINLAVGFFVVSDYEISHMFASSISVALKLISTSATEL